MIQVYQNLVHLYQVLVYHCPGSVICFIISVLLYARKIFAADAGSAGYWHVITAHRTGNLRKKHVNFI